MKQDNHATVAELVDAQDLGSCGATRGGSSPSGRIGWLPTLRATHPRVARSPSTPPVTAYQSLSLVSVAIRLRLRLSHALLPDPAVLLQAGGPIDIASIQSLRVLPPQHAKQAGLREQERYEARNQ